MSTENGSAPPAGNPPADGGQATSWTANIEDADIRGYAELKGWKDPASAIQSYRNLEKMQGVPPERLAKIPDANDAEGWKAFNGKFGWAPPADPKEYNLPVPDGFTRDFADAMSAKFLEIGVPAELGRKIAAAANEHTIAKMQADEQAIELEHQTDLAKLKTEWGGNFEQLQQLADRASDGLVKSGAVSAEDMEAMRDTWGTAKFMKFFATLGGQQGEAKFVSSDTGGSVNGMLTPEAAQVRLNELGRDREWFARYEKGGVQERQEYQRLRQIVANATLQAR